jgi:hypothetical protein
MEMRDINAGARVLIVDVRGYEYETTALSGVEKRGHAFPVVWVERPLNGGGTDQVPWPASDVRYVGK